MKTRHMKKRVSMFADGMYLFLKKEYDTVLLFIGVTLLFFLGMNLVRTQTLIKKATEPRYLYVNDYFTDGKWSEEMMNRAMCLFEGTGDNCVLRDVSAPVGYTNDYQEILLYLSAEALAKREKIDLAKWNETPNAVLIESRLRSRCYKKDGKMNIIIAGTEFSVYGIIEENEILAQSVHINWKNMDEDHRKKYMERQNFYIERLYNDGIPLQVQSLNKFGDEVARFERDFENDVRASESFYEYSLYWKREIYRKMKILYSVMEVFGIFSLYFLVELWFARRKREFLIRRMLGYSVLRIWGVALKEAGSAILLAFGSAMLIELLQLSLHVAGTLGVQDVFQILMNSFLFTLLLVMALFGVYIWRIVRINPTQQNIEDLA